MNTIHRNTDMSGSAEEEMWANGWGMLLPGPASAAFISVQDTLAMYFVHKESNFNCVSPVILVFLGL